LKHGRLKSRVYGTKGTKSANSPKKKELFKLVKDTAQLIDPRVNVSSIIGYSVLE